MKTSLAVLGFLFIQSLALAPEALAHGDLHLQIEEVTRKIEKDPKNVDLLLKRAGLQHNHEDPDSALADLDRAAQINPKHDAIHLLRSQVLLGVGYRNAARVAVDRYLSARPEDPEGLLIRARLREASEDHRGAAEDYSRVISKVREGLPDLYVDRARVQAELGDAGVAEAIRGLDEGIARIGKVISLQIPAIELERKRKNPEGAIKRLDEILAEATHKDEWLFMKGEILESAGRIIESREAYAASKAALDALPERLKKLPVTQERRKKVEAKLRKQPARKS